MPEQSASRQPHSLTVAKRIVPGHAKAAERFNAALTDLEIDKTHPISLTNGTPPGCMPWKCFGQYLSPLRPARHEFQGRYGAPTTRRKSCLSANARPRAQNRVWARTNGLYELSLEAVLTTVCSSPECKLQLRQISLWRERVQEIQIYASKNHP